MFEHQKVQKRSQKIQSIKDKRRHLQKDSTTAEEEMRKLQESSSKKRSVSFVCRTKSIITSWRMQKWRQNFRVCRQEKKEEAVMLRRQVSAAWRTCGNSLSPWGRIEFRSLYNGSKEKWEQLRSRCQEEKKEEGIVKTNKSKTKPVSSWRCQRQASAMKALHRVVWSLIFLVFWVHLVNAE